MAASEELLQRTIQTLLERDRRCVIAQVQQIEPVINFLEVGRWEITD